MKMIKKLTAVAAVFAMGISAFAFDGKEVIQKAIDIEEPAFSQSQVVMELIDKNGVKDTRNIIEYGRSKNGLKAIVMDFVGPNNSKVKGTRFLLQEKGDNKDDEKFIYLPELRQSRRVNTADGSKEFVGSDATYDDLSTRDIEKDKHEAVKEETKNGFDCFVVKSTAVNPNDSQYGYRLQWIDKKTYVPVYAEMYDKKGKLLKTLTVEKLEPVANAAGTKTYNTPMVTLMKNVQTGHSTRLTIRKIVVDQPLKDGIFTQNFLSTGK